jgi:hypothetical protein
MRRVFLLPSLPMTIYTNSDLPQFIDNCRYKKSDGSCDIILHLFNIKLFINLDFLISYVLIYRYEKIGPFRAFRSYCSFSVKK